MKNRNIPYSDLKDLYYNGEKQIYIDSKVLLNDFETKKFDEIINYFRLKKKLSQEDYYSYIKSLCNFSCLREDFSDLKKTIVTGIYTAKFKMKYNNYNGHIVALNVERVSKLLNKDRHLISKFLNNSDYSEMLSDFSLNQLLKDYYLTGEKIACNLMSVFDLLDKLNIKLDIYFIKDQKIKCFFDLRSIIKIDTSKVEQLKQKKYPNNYKFLSEWTQKQKIINDNSDIKNQIKKCSKIFDYINNIFQNILVNIDSLNIETSLNKKLSNIHKNHSDSTETDINKQLKTSHIQIKYISEFIKYIVNRYIEKDINLMSKINSNENDEQKKINMINIIKDIIDHSKGESWNETILKMGFLIKYCSSSSYKRLYLLSNNKIPPPTTIESHFEKKMDKIEKSITNPKELTNILDDYFNLTKNKIEHEIASKIEVCISCDAASLTSFTCNGCKNKKDKEKKKKISKSKKNSIVKTIFKDIIEGKKVEELNDKFEADKLSTNDPHYFFTMILQPLDWRLPILVIHFSKSATGKFTIREAKDLRTILSIINCHPNFHAHFFAADGEVGLNSYHEQAFKKYCNDIPRILKGEITIEEFIKKVDEIIKVIPMIDPLHAVKSGRSKILDNNVKLSDNTDIINADILAESLNLNTDVLKDKSSIGKMKDVYALQLFSALNAFHEFEKNHYASSFYILFYSIFLEIFRNSYLSLQMRTSLADFLLLLILKLIESSSSLPSETSFRKNKKSKNKYVWFQEKISLIKLLNTIIGVCICLHDKKLSKFLGLERLTSHPVEQYFGNYRTHFFGNYQFVSAFKYAIRTILSIEFQNELGVTFAIPTRDNYGGAHLNYFDKHENDIDIYDFNSKYLLSDLYIISQNIYEKAFDPKAKLHKITNQFFKDFHDFIEDHPSFVNLRYSLTKGSSIVPKLISCGKSRKNEISSFVQEPQLNYTEEHQKYLCINKKSIFQSNSKLFMNLNQFLEIQQPSYGENEIDIGVEMTNFQIELYKKHFNDQISDYIFNNNLELNIHILQNIANHPLLLPKKFIKETLKNEDFNKMLILSSGKLIIMDKLLTKIQEEKHTILILSNIDEMVDLIEFYLQDKDIPYYRLNGSNGKINKTNKNENENKCFLSSIKSYGYDITKSDIVIIFDSFLSPAVLQNKKIYRLFTIGTIEEDLYMNFITNKTISIKSKKDINFLLRRNAYFTFYNQQNTTFFSDPIEEIINNKISIRSPIELDDKYFWINLYSKNIRECKEIPLDNKKMKSIAESIIDDGCFETQNKFHNDIDSDFYIVILIYLLYKSIDKEERNIFKTYIQKIKQISKEVIVTKDTIAMEPFDNILYVHELFGEDLYESMIKIYSNDRLFICLSFISTIKINQIGFIFAQSMNAPIYWSVNYDYILLYTCYMFEFNTISIKKFRQNLEKMKILVGNLNLPNLNWLKNRISIMIYEIETIIPEDFFPSIYPLNPSQWIDFYHPSLSLHLETKNMILRVLRFLYLFGFPNEYKIVYLKEKMMLHSIPDEIITTVIFYLIKSSAYEIDKKEKMEKQKKQSSFKVLMFLLNKLKPIRYIDVSWVDKRARLSLANQLIFFIRLRNLDQKIKDKTISSIDHPKWDGAPDWWDFDCDKILIDVVAKNGLISISNLIKIGKIKSKLTKIDKDEIKDFYIYENKILGDNSNVDIPNGLKELAFLKKIEIRVKILQKLMDSLSISLIE